MLGHSLALYSMTHKILIPTLLHLFKIIKGAFNSRRSTLAERDSLASTVSIQEDFDQ